MGSSPDAALAKMIENLKAKTGRSLEEWVRVARASNKAKHGEIVAFLKSEHELGHGYANLVAQHALGTITMGPGAVADGDELVEGQYSGAKAGLRPWYDRLVKEIRGFGADVDIAPKKAYVSLRRKKQFGLIQPSTAERLDVGINLKGTPAGGRLEASGSFNAMVSHRVRVTAPEQIDAELVAWLRAAYEAS